MRIDREEEEHGIHGVENDDRSIPDRMYSLKMVTRWIMELFLPKWILVRPTYVASSDTIVTFVRFLLTSIISFGGTQVSTHSLEKSVFSVLVCHGFDSQQQLI
ncbi:hypothetical protein RB195_012403 [Necator americanus]|uniref:Pecanex-like protein n=1 Tax=Necator americanus TaxID=51031 RepID=A0ABR1D6X6_NECAM